MDKQKTLFHYLLRLGDSGLILSQRLSEWTSQGPFLEEDLALTNIALDILGRSKSLLAYACQIEDKGRTEDDLAFFRGERDFYNLLLTEHPNGDYAQTIVRQYLLDEYELLLYQHLSNCPDPTISGISSKAIKEITYHLRHTSKWMERFGKGTEESHKRVQQGIDSLWRFTGDLFDADDIDAQMQKEKIAPDLSELKASWLQKVKEVFERSDLKMPESVFMLSGSRKAVHTEHLGFLLAEMQHLPRMYPQAKW